MCLCAYLQTWDMVWCMRALVSLELHLEKLKSKILGLSLLFSAENVDGKDYSFTVVRKWVATEAVVPKLTFLFSQEHPGLCSCWWCWDGASLHPCCWSRTLVPNSWKESSKFSFLCTVIHRSHYGMFSEVSLCKFWKVTSRQQHQNIQVLDYPFPAASLSLRHVVEWEQRDQVRVKVGCQISKLLRPLYFIAAPL